MNVKGLARKLMDLEEAAGDRGQRLPRGCKTHAQWMLRLERWRALWRSWFIRGEITEAEYRTKTEALGQLFPEMTAEQKEEARWRSQELLAAFKRAIEKEEQRQRDIADGKRQEEATQPADLGLAGRISTFEPAPPPKKPKLSEQTIADQINDVLDKGRYHEIDADPLAPYRGRPVTPWLEPEPEG